MAIMTPNRIVLISRGRHDEAASAADIYPGMALVKNSSGLVIPHNVIGGISPLLIAEEDALRGLDITQKMASGNVVGFRLPAKGDRFLMLLQNGQNVANGDPLMSAGDGTLIASTGLFNSVLYQILAASTGITNTTTETTFSNGSYSVAANSLKAGDVLKIRGRAVVSAQNSTNTHRVQLYLGSTVIVDATALALAATQYVEFNVFVTVRSIGASGSFIVDGTVANNAGGTAAILPVNVAATTLDTTTAEVIKVTSTASAASTGNVIALQEFEIDLQRNGGTSTMVYAAEAKDNSGGTGTSGFNSAAFIRVDVP